MTSWPTTALEPTRIIRYDLPMSRRSFHIAARFAQFCRSGPDRESIRSLMVWLIAASQFLVAASVAAAQGEPAKPPASPAEHVYAKPGGTELKAYVFSPDKPGKVRRPAMAGRWGSRRGPFPARNTSPNSE